MDCRRVSRCPLVGKDGIRVTLASCQDPHHKEGAPVKHLLIGIAFAASLLLACTRADTPPSTPAPPPTVEITATIQPLAATVEAQPAGPPLPAVQPTAAPRPTPTPTATPRPEPTPPPTVVPTPLPTATPGPTAAPPPPGPASLPDPTVRIYGPTSGTILHEPGNKAGLYAFQAA